MGHASCMHSRTCIPAVIWHTHNGQHAADTIYLVRVLPGIPTCKQRTFHNANFTTKEHRKTAVLQFQWSHNTLRGIVYCTSQLWYTQCNDTRWCNSGTYMYDCDIRAGRKRSKIEISMLTISIKDRDRRRIFPIFDPDNRGEDGSLRRRSRSPTLIPVQFIVKWKKRQLWERKDFVETDFCKLRGILRSRVLLILLGVLCNLIKNVSPCWGGQNLTAVELSECTGINLWL